MSFIVRGKPSPWSTVKRSHWDIDDIANIYVRKRWFCITDKDLKYTLNVVYNDNGINFMYIHPIPIFYPRFSGVATYRYKTLNDAFHDHDAFYNNRNFLK